jgi:hypothetical protein
MAVGGGQRGGEPMKASLTFESWVKKNNVSSLPLLYQLSNPAAHSRVGAQIRSYNSGS